MGSVRVGRNLYCAACNIRCNALGLLAPYIVGRLLLIERIVDQRGGMVDWRVDIFLAGGFGLEVQGDVAIDDIRMRVKIIYVVAADRNA